MNLSVSLGLVLLLLAGCSSPYISYPAVQEYVVEEASPGRRVLREAYPSTRQIRYARWYLGQIGEELQAKHSQESGARAALLGATFAGAAGGAVAGAFGAGRDLLTGFAAGASGSATASSLFLDRGKAAAYRAGMRALDCIDTRARMQQAYFIELQNADWRYRRLVAFSERNAVRSSTQQALLDVAPAIEAISTRRAFEAEETARIIAFGKNVIGLVNEEVARLEPEPSHIVQVGGQLASDIGPVAVNNLASGLDFRRTIKSAQDVAQVAARTADPTPKQQGSLSDMAETVASAPVDGTSEPSTTSAKAELQKLAAALDAIRLELDGAGSLPPSCPGVGLIPIYSASGSLITIGRGEVVTTLLAGGSGSYLVQPSAPLPAGLKTQVVGRVLTISADGTVPDNNYPITVRDTPSDPERRPMELSMTIVVHGIFRPGAGASVDLGSGLPSIRSPTQRQNGVAAQGTGGVFANDLLERAANTAVLGPLLGSSFARERDPRQRSESLRRAYAQVLAAHPTWGLPSQPSKTALDMIEDKNVATPP